MGYFYETSVADSRFGSQNENFPKFLAQKYTCDLPIFSTEFRTFVQICMYLRHSGTYFLYARMKHVFAISFFPPPFIIDLKNALKIKKSKIGFRPGIENMFVNNVHKFEPIRCKTQ